MLCGEPPVYSTCIFELVRRRLAELIVQRPKLLEALHKLFLGVVLVRVNEQSEVPVDLGQGAFEDSDSKEGQPRGLVVQVRWNLCSKQLEQSDGNGFWLHWWSRRRTRRI